MVFSGRGAGWQAPSPQDTVTCLREAMEPSFKDILLFDDGKHSEREPRWYVLGRTDANRSLFVVFTARESKIRVISSRDMSRKERNIYEKEKQKHS